MIEFLIALALFSSDFHSGQSDPWYSRSCLARKYLLQWFQIRDPEDWITANYVHVNYQRRAKGIYFMLARKYLKSSPVCYNSAKSRFN
jgi:hypothetical protein